MFDVTTTAVDFPSITLNTDSIIDNNTISISRNSISNTNHASVSIDGNMNVNGDIVVGGQSLLDKIKKIEQRLNILEPNHRLEKDWKELTDLGKQYRALEKKIEERLKVWDRLQSQDTE